MENQSVTATAAFKRAAPTGRAGGVYIPPHRLAAMQAQAAGDSEKQRFAWETLRKSINGLINKVNVANMANIVAELLRENLIRGRGLLCRAVLKAQMASPGFTHVYAALIAIINTKLPQIGELLLKRIVIQFRRAYKRNNKVVAVALAKFAAHLVNQQVAHELLSLQIITLMLERPSDDSVEVAISFVKECGQMLAELTPTGMNAIFDRFRGILHEGDIDKRVQYMIEGLFAVRKSKFAEYPAVMPELDLVEREDQITHEISLDDTDLDAEEMLDVFAFDADYEKNEEAWKAIRTEILGDDEEEEGQGGEGDGQIMHDEDITEEVEEHLVTAPSVSAATTAPITDMSETDLINLRRTIYLTIMSSVDFEECAHKLMKLKIPRGTEGELANMLIECCSQERTYMRYYGLLGQRFCLISSIYQEAFEAAFATQYAQIHRLETNKLRNVAKFFAHLLCNDALPWTIFEYIHLNEQETTSSSRIFIKILMQELSEFMGLVQLRDRFAEPTMQPSYSGIFPTDDPKKTRFSINFFTSIGLGALTDDMRAHLKALANKPAPPPAPAPVAAVRRRSASRRSRSASSSRSSSGSRSSYSSSSSRSSRSRSRSSYSTGSSRSSSSYTSSSDSESSYGRRRRSRRSPSTSRSRSRRRSPSVSRSRSRRRSGPSVSPRRGRPSRSRTEANSKAAPRPEPKAVAPEPVVDLMADERKDRPRSPASPGARPVSRDRDLQSAPAVDRREREDVEKPRQAVGRSRSRERYARAPPRRDSRSPRRRSRSPRRDRR